jgi:hypothetical protein
MAQINIRDETRDRINTLIQSIEQNPNKNPYIKITQDYIISKALDKLEVKQ